MTADEIKLEITCGEPLDAEPAEGWTVVSTCDGHQFSGEWEPMAPSETRHRCRNWDFKKRPTGSRHNYPRKRPAEFWSQENKRVRRRARAQRKAALRGLLQKVDQDDV